MIDIIDCYEVCECEQGAAPKSMDHPPIELHMCSLCKRSVIDTADLIKMADAIDALSK